MDDEQLMEKCKLLEKALSFKDIFLPLCHYGLPGVKPLNLYVYEFIFYEPGTSQWLR